CELGKEGAFIWVNQTAAEMFGYKSPEEMIGTKVNEIYVNIDDGRTQLEMLEKHGVLSNTVYLCKNKSGDCFYAECTSHLVKDKKGKQCRIEGIIRVITERKKSEYRLIAQHAVTKILSESETIKIAFQGILKVICEALDWDFGSLWLEHDNVLRCVYLWHVPGLQFSEFKKKTKEISFLPGIGLPGRVLSKGKAAWIKDVVVESNFPRATAASKVGLHGAFAFPIIANTEILGVIEFFSQKPEEPDKELLNMMEAIGSQVGQFIKRKQADEQVSKLSRAVEQSPVSVVITDTKNNIEYVNRKYTEVTGYSLEEVKGKNPIVLKTVEENVEEHKELWKTITSGKEWQGEFCNFNKNGEIYWESESISPIKNCDGIITGFIQLKEDITERKLVQSHLKTQLEVAKVLAESNTIREASTRIIEVVCIALGWDLGEVWIYDKQQYILRNTEIWHLPSLNFSEFKDITCRTTFSPQKGLPGLVWQTAKPLWIEDVARDSNFLRASVADKEGLHGAFGFPIAIDNVVLGTICFFSREIRRPDDKLLNMMSSIGNHIALFIERKQADEQISKLSRAVEQSPASVVITDTKGNIEYVNRKFTEVTGYSFEEVKGKNPRVLKSDERNSVDYKELWDTISSGKEWRGEFKNKNSDGKAYWEFASISPIKNNQGVTTGYIAIKEDITVHKNLEQQLMHAQKMESIGHLAAGIAHEINTPTQYIMDNTRFLQDSFNDINKLLEKYSHLLETCKSGSVESELIEEIEVAVRELDEDFLVDEIPNAITQSLEGLDRVKNIVYAMKNFSHPDNENKKPIDINKAINNTITVARNEWKYVAEVKTDFDSSLTSVPCFPGEFNQVILNLIVNAAHAIGEEPGNGNEGKGIIVISTLCDGEWAEIRVSDTGTGISGDIRKKIFDPFFTTKEVGKGTGQGLSLVHSTVVGRHNGTITLDTELGKGTTFIIRLPLCTSSSEIVKV
ncbi:signal transduction histidine kinase, partial [Candidatus Scalindua japonica]